MIKVVSEEMILEMRTGLTANITDEESHRTFETMST